MKEEIIEVNDIVEDSEALTSDEAINNDNSVLHIGVKLALILTIAAIAGFLLKDVFISFANWIIFN